MIQCSSLNKIFSVGLFSQTIKKAIIDVSFHVQQNEIFGIVGLNGAGKSTIIKVLMGFIRPTSGTALITNYGSIGLYHHSRIGYLPENPALYSNLTISEHLRFKCNLNGISSKDATKHIQLILEKTGLAEAGNTLIKRYSKGMIQRAALAYSILLEPEILILDEPMSGLDPFGRQLVVNIIKEFHSKGATILFCSHILSDVQRICDRIGIMHHGRMTKIFRMPLKEPPHSSTISTTLKYTNLEEIFFETIQDINS